jgi:primosomal protein N' (replication factor Y)
MNDITHWKVAVEAPLFDALTYSGSAQMPLCRGQSVYVPLGRGQRMTRGMVLGPSQPYANEKPINSVDPDFPLLPEKYLQWLEWVANYYIYPIGLTTQLAFPPLKKSIKERKSSRPPVIPVLEKTARPNLTPEQKKVFEDIAADPGFNVHLVFGVTGSGKTEVYLRLLEKVLESGQTGMVLVPEISLTPQLINRFVERFGDRIAALHSQLTTRERTNQWWDIIDGRKSILIGARFGIDHR